MEIFGDRIPWKRGPTFDPRPFLHDLELQAGWAVPRVLRIRPGGASKGPGKVHASREEFFKLLKWDSMGSLLLEPAAGCPRGVRCGAFAVAKDTDSERFILNPTAENGLCRGANRWAGTLSPGCMLCALVLEVDRGFAVDSDDSGTTTMLL